MSAIESKVAVFVQDMDKLHDIVHGDATKVVSTVGGDIPSFAKFQADNLGALISQATTAAGQAVAANEAIGDAATTATEAATAATTAKTNAETARDITSGYRNQAQTAASNAGLSETAAATSAGQAQTAEATATTKAAEAVGARDVAVTAKDNAQTAATNAATSETNALSHKNDANTSAIAAGTSETNALSSKNAAESAKTAAESAMTAAETSASDAYAARVLAQDYANAGVGIEVEAGKYSAYHWAQQVAATVTGGIVFRGPWSAASGAYPTPSDADVAGDMYKVTVAGTIGAVSYAIGDSIIYEGTVGTWFKVDGTDAVQTVNGRIGNITLVAADVNLGNVANLAPADLPVSTATAAALALKASQTDLNTVATNAQSANDAIAAHTANMANPHGLTKTQINLGNVEDKSSATIRSELTLSNVTTALGFTPVNVANVSTNGTLSENSDTLLPTQQAVRTYVQAAFAANDAMIYKGAINASTNPNFPAADAGHTYRFSVGGRIGGAAGALVEAGDMMTCSIDGSIAGDLATVGGNWVIVQTNLDGVVMGPATAVNNRVAFFDGASGKLLKDSGLTLAGNNTGDETETTLGNKIAGATAKSAVADADSFPMSDSVSSNVLRKISWSQIKAALMTAMGVLINAATWKAAPDGNDYVLGSDSVAAFATKKFHVNGIAQQGFDTFGARTAQAAVKATPVDADLFSIADSAASSATKSLSIANLKVFLAAVAWNFTGSITIARALTKFVRELVTVSATAANGTIAFDAITQGIVYYTASSTANFGLNVRGDATNTLNSLMGVGESLTVVFMATNGGTAYYANSFQVDGVSVTVKWQDASAPTSGNASAIDLYSYTIIKTASAAYTVLGSRVKYA